ncbi:MAG: SPOR domain-containing protein [Pseudobdellovibrio sp.]
MTVNTNRIIELSLVFFISLFSFSIGTFVGKKYSDNQHRLSQLEPNKKIEDQHSETTASGHNEGQHGEKAAESHDPNDKNSHSIEAKSESMSDGEITDADVAKLAEEFANTAETKVESKTGHGDTHAKVKTETHTEAKTLTHSAAIKTAEKEVKEISTHEANNERDIASVPAKVNSMTAANAQYTVQIGSYPEESEAQKVSDSLIARGYKANTVPADVKGKTWYRVQVGMFRTVAEAQDYKKELMEKNKLSSAIVQKIVPKE